MTTIDDLKAASEDVAEALSTLILSIFKAFKEGRDNPQKAPEVIAQIGEVLRTVGEVPMVAPEGVEFAMRVFIHCDAADLSHVLNFPGNHMMPPRDPTGHVEVAELIEQIPNAEQRAMLKAAGSWRVMSRAEISRYKARMARLAQYRQEEAEAGRGTMRPFREQ